MKKTIYFLIALIVLCVGVSFFYAEAFATDENIDLYNSTNTFNYEPNYEKNCARYDLSIRNANVVDDGDPLITVFTHGLGGDASHWSNVEGDFAYSGDSLVSRLARNVNSNIYWVKAERYKYDLYDVSTYFNSENETGEVIKIGADSTIKLGQIKDISKHLIIIFEAADTNGPNDIVYSEFNYAISRIVFDVKKLNNGKLPKINLIGHSRGGITNMQYALDHPDLVDSIYSFGTPYLGSTSASIDYYFLGSEFANEIAESDIVNSNVYLKYLERWNSNYEELYSKIKVTALGGYSTLYGLCKSLTTEKSISFISNEKHISKEKLQVLIPSVLGSIDGIIMSFYFITPIVSIKPLIAKGLMSIASELINELNLDIGPNDLLQIFQNEIFLDYHPPFVSW